MPRYKFVREEITTIEELQDMIDKTRYEWLKSLLAFLYLFGCRVSEALQLRRRNLWIESPDLAARIGVLKRRERSKGPYQTVDHILRVNLKAPFISDYLLPYLEKLRPEQKVWSVSRQLVWLRMKEVNQQCSPHVFRHDRLMKLAQKGATEAELMDWAGWSDPRPAGDYIRATGRLAARLADKVD